MFGHDPAITSRSRSGLHHYRFHRNRWHTRHTRRAAAMALRLHAAHASSYITNAAGLATADFLRRVTTIAYRTRELQIARPDSGIGSAERSRWEDHEGWQPARKAVEYALVTYDSGRNGTAQAG